MQDTLWTRAAETILEIEGGKTTDHAGPTNMGITLRFLIANESVDRDGDGFLDGDYDRDGDIDQADLDMMDSVGALALYKRHFWDKHGYGTIHPHGPVCVKLFDLSVNMGPVQAHKLLQRAARAMASRSGMTGSSVRAPVTPSPAFRAPLCWPASAARPRSIGSSPPNDRTSTSSCPAGFGGLTSYDQDFPIPRCPLPVRRRLAGGGLSRHGARYRIRLGRYRRPAGLSRRGDLYRPCRSGGG